MWKGTHDFLCGSGLLLIMQLYVYPLYSLAFYCHEPLPSIVNLKTLLSKADWDSHIFRRPKSFPFLLPQAVSQAC